MNKLYTSGYGFLGAGAIPNGTAILFFIDKNGNFVFVGVDDKQNACEIIHGDSWNFTLQREI